MKKFSLVTALALIALALVPAKAQAPGDTFSLNWNGTGPEIGGDHSLLQDVTALDESGNSIHGTQINVTALYDKPANQWSEGVKCVTLICVPWIEFPLSSSAVTSCSNE